MTREDMMLLVEVEDELWEMNKVMRRFTGMGLQEGAFNNIGGIYEVIRSHVHSSYLELPEEEDTERVLIEIISNMELTVEERVDLLLSGIKADEFCKDVFR
ncbi:MAG: hypothetical protein HFJ06_00575 [Lachnospiraceae bacterium]|nr:hypothetical protein [Lachnospiraceae bacterium]